MDWLLQERDLFQKFFDLLSKNFDLIFAIGDFFLLIGNQLVELQNGLLLEGDVRWHGLDLLLELGDCAWSTFSNVLEILQGMVELPVLLDQRRLHLLQLIDLFFHLQLHLSCQFLGDSFLWLDSDRRSEFVRNLFLQFFNPLLKRRQPINLIPQQPDPIFQRDDSLLIHEFIRLQERNCGCKLLVWGLFLWCWWNVA